ncbi:uncharacterized protein [Taeniopygia guttata]|uniref:uncharacterized protein n=1 Tax=Taeniopygia guttata TaxID=59729 RepID=UPI003BB886E8
MSALDRVRGGGRSLDRRLDAVSGQALLAGLRAAGAVSEPEVAALGPPDSSGWARRLRALAAAKGDRTCRVLLTVLEGLEGPPRPGPFDFYDPERDAAAGHRSDCPCCRPEPQWTRQEEEEEPKIGDEGPKNDDEGHEDEDGEPKNDDEGHEDDEEPNNEDEGHEDDEGEPKNDDEGHEDDEEPQNDDEGHEDDEGEPENEDEGHEDDDGGDED